MVQTRPQQQAPQPWPPYPGYPPPPQSRRWFPYAVFAAIVVAGAMIAAAIVISGQSSETSTPAAAPSAAAPTSAAAPVAPEDTATCTAWRTARTELEAMPEFPDGWNWNTPGIDDLIAKTKPAVDRTLDKFEAKIAPGDPPNVVVAANAYVKAKRTDMAKIADHTLTEAIDGAVNPAFDALVAACHPRRY